MPRRKLQISELRERADAALAEIQLYHSMQEPVRQELVSWVARVKHRFYAGKLDRYERRAVARLFKETGLDYLKWQERLMKILNVHGVAFGTFSRGNLRWLREQLFSYRTVSLSSTQMAEMARVLSEMPFLTEIDKLHIWRRSLVAANAFFLKTGRVPAPAEREFCSIIAIRNLLGLTTGASFVKMWLSRNGILSHFEPILVSSNQWTSI